MVNSSPSKTWPETKKGRFIILAGLLGLFGLVFYMTINSRGTIEPALTIEQEYLWFGEVFENSEFAFRLPIRNTTNEDIEILDFATSCNCTKTKPDNLLVPARGTAEIKLIINLGSIANKKTEAKQEIVEVKIVPRIKGTIVRQSGWVVHGAVKYTYRIHPRTVLFEFPLVYGGQYKNNQKHVKITPEIEVAHLRAECEPDLGITEITKTGQDYDLAVAPKQSIEVKPFAFDVKISGVTEKGLQLPPKRIKVSGEIVEPVRCVPSQLSFGPRNIGEEVEDVVTLISANGQSFQIIGNETILPGVEIKPLEQFSSDSRMVRIKQRIVKTGYALGDLTFFVKQGNRPIKATCVVAYYGISTDTAFNPRLSGE